MLNFSCMQSNWVTGLGPCFEWYRSRSRYEGMIEESHWIRVIMHYRASVHILGSCMSLSIIGALTCVHNVVLITAVGRGVHCEPDCDPWPYSVSAFIHVSSVSFEGQSVAPSQGWMTTTLSMTWTFYSRLLAAYVCCSVFLSLTNLLGISVISL